MKFPAAEDLRSCLLPGCCGVYQLRHRSTKQRILFGIANSLAERMRSLLPRPFGIGTRNNLAKREYVLQHIADVEFRTVKCASRAEAIAFENELKAARNHLFNT